MLDIKRIRENTEAVKRGLRAQGDRADIDRILALDEERRALQTAMDALRAEVNAESKKIGEVKKSGGDAEAQMHMCGGSRSAWLGRSAPGRSRRGAESAPSQRAQRARAGGAPGDESHNVEVRTWGHADTSGWQAPHWENR